MIKHFATISVVSIGVLFAMVCSQNVNAVNSSDLIYSKDSKPYGLSFSEWIAKWWNWHYNLPNKVNLQNPDNFSQIHPREAYSPEKCAWNQTDNNVWFLPDGRNLLFSSSEPETRQCTVPHEKALLVQIYGGGCSFAEGFKTDQELKDCVNIGLNSVEFTAKVDGIEVMNSKDRDLYLPDAYLYNQTLAKDNYYELPAGTWRAMAGGYFLFVKPLDIGNHTIEFKETYFKPGFEGQPSNENRISNVMYNLTVK